MFSACLLPGLFCGVVFCRYVGFYALAGGSVACGATHDCSLLVGEVNSWVSLFAAGHEVSGSACRV
jgi:hypothetical protein